MQTLSDLRAGRLAGATQLRLNGPLSEFPEELYDLADTLEVLEIANSGLNQLPDDFARLKKLKILFAPSNDFQVFPEVLSDCPALTMVGFKGNRIHTIPDIAIPPRANWVILTDNQIETLPASFGRLSRLQKCMLAGNRLSSLPSTMRDCDSLQLLRLSANRFTELPDFLLDLPRLSWLAFAGNPFHQSFKPTTALPRIQLSDLIVGEPLGSGASGTVSRAKWIRQPETLDARHGEVAYKAFKGAMTSDGFATDELSATLAAGQHNGLVSPLAMVDDGATPGLVMSLIPDGFYNLGKPPNFETCTRDVFPADMNISLETATKILSSVAETMAHLHGQGVCHNDLYAHNILINDDGAALLTDFGAAANLKSLPASQRARFEKIEVSAFGYLIDDLLGLVSPGERQSDGFAELSELTNTCQRAAVNERPDFRAIQQSLNSHI